MRVHTTGRRIVHEGIGILRPSSVFVSLVVDFSDAGELVEVARGS